MQRMDRMTAHFQHVPHQQHNLRNSNLTKPPHILWGISGALWFTVDYKMAGPVNREIYPRIEEESCLISMSKSTISG